MVATTTITITVDDEDADLLGIKSSFRNPSMLANKIARRSLGVKPKGYHVDHIDQDWTNNTRKNLRYLQARDNIRRNGTNKYYGVSYHKQGDYYQVHIKRFGKSVYCGSHKTEIEAAYAVDNWLREHGEVAVNFPNEYHTVSSSEKRVGASSQYIGVTWHKARYMWQVQIREKGSRSYIGVYSDEIQAAKAYDAYVVKHGLKRKLNFPEDYK